MSTIIFSFTTLPTSYVLLGSKEVLQRGVFGHHHLLLHALHEGGSRHFAHHDLTVDLGGFVHGLRHGGDAVLDAEWREMVSTENIGWFLYPLPDTFHKSCALALSAMLMNTRMPKSFFIVFFF
mgnify:CR=1 FL=1